MKFNLSEAAKKNIYSIKYLDKNQNKSFATVPAYSKNQAALILKKTEGYNNVYRILDIECIEDNSIDDGEQLSLFEEDMKFKLTEDIQQDKKMVRQIINDTLPFYLEQQNYKGLAQYTSILQDVLKRIPTTLLRNFSVITKDTDTGRAVDARVIAQNYIGSVEGVLNFTLYSSSDKDIAQGYFEVEFDDNIEVEKAIIANSDILFTSAQIYLDS